MVLDYDHKNKKATIEASNNIKDSKIDKQENKGKLSKGKSKSKT